MDDATKLGLLHDLDRDLERTYFDSAPYTKLRRLTFELHCELMEMGVVRVWPTT